MPMRVDHPTSSAYVPAWYIALWSLRIIDRVGKVQREMPAQNGQLARVLHGVAYCFHQNPLYQFIPSEALGMFSS